MIQPSGFQYLQKTADGSSWSQASLGQSVQQVFQQFDAQGDGLDRAEFSTAIKNRLGIQGSTEQLNAVLDKVFKQSAGLPDQGNQLQGTQYATVSPAELVHLLITADSQQLTATLQSQPSRPNAGDGVLTIDELLLMASNPLSDLDTYLTAQDGASQYSEPLFGPNPEAPALLRKSQQNSVESLIVTADNLPRLLSNPQSAPIAQSILLWQDDYNARQLQRIQGSMPADQGTTDPTFWEYLPEPLARAIAPFLSPPTGNN